MSEDEIYKYLDNDYVEEIQYPYYDCYDKKEEVTPKQKKKQNLAVGLIATVFELLGEIIVKFFTVIGFFIQTAFVLAIFAMPFVLIALLMRS